MTDRLRAVLTASKHLRGERVLWRDALRLRPATRAYAQGERIQVTAVLRAKWMPRAQRRAGLKVTGGSTSSAIPSAPARSHRPLPVPPVSTAISTLPPNPPPAWSRCGTAETPDKSPDQGELLTQGRAAWESDAAAVGVVYRLAIPGVAESLTPWSG